MAYIRIAVRSESELLTRPFIAPRRRHHRPRRRRVVCWQGDLCSMLAEV